MTTAVTMASNKPTKRKTAVGTKIFDMLAKRKKTVSCDVSVLRSRIEDETNSSDDDSYLLGCSDSETSSVCESGDNENHNNSSNSDWVKLQQPGNNLTRFPFSVQKSELQLPNDDVPSTIFEFFQLFSDDNLLLDIVSNTNAYCD